MTEGLDQRGFLQVRTAQGVRTVLSGTVRFAETGIPGAARALSGIIRGCRRIRGGL